MVVYGAGLVSPPIKDGFDVVVAGADRRDIVQVACSRTRGLRQQHAHLIVEDSSTALVVDAFDYISLSVAIEIGDGHRIGDESLQRTD